MKRFLYVVFFFSYTNIIFPQSWQSIGPPGGYFKDFVIHPTNPQIIFAGSDDSGGIWKSNDAGTTWSLTTSSIPNFSGWKIVVDPYHTNTIYGCDMYGRYGVIKSINGGNTWQISSTGLGTIYEKMVSGLVTVNGTPDTLLISTGTQNQGTPPRPGNGIWKSFNGGATWTAAGLQGITAPCIASNGQGGAIFVGTEGFGLKISTNLGTTWITHPQIISTATISEIESDSNIVLVSTLFNGVYLSTDYGNNFTNIGLTADFTFDVNIFKKVPTVELFSSSGSGLKKYSSATNSWTLVNDPLLQNYLCMGIASKSNTIMCSNFNNGLIIRSTNGGSAWNSIAQSPKATEVGGMYINPVNSNHIIASVLGSYNFATNKGAVSETTDGGNTWTRKGPLAHGRGLIKDNSTTATFYLGTFGNGLYKTIDAFNTFTNVRSGNKVIYDVAVNPSNPQEILVSELDITSTTHSILKSTDGGNTYTVTSSLICTKLEYDPINSANIYASTFAGIFVSNDGGSSWNNLLFIGIPQTCVKPTAQHFYCSRLDGYLVKANGTNTVNITGPWPANSHINNIIEHNGRLVIGINGAEKDTLNNLHGATYLSPDSGTTWINITGNMPCTHVYGMKALQGSNSDLFVATYGGGIYKLSNIVTTTFENHKTLTILSAYPNPANDKIHFNKNVFAIVYDMNGKLKFRGETKEINVDQWPQGIYFVKSGNDSFKMIVSH
ncbi:MAG: T9SS type A sorting domain-containing protein [Bacteroidota bacterium]|nr:T9SS type A sorting domain-containing protein [Bacteroidota bacterium]